MKRLIIILSLVVTLLLSACVKPKLEEKLEGHKYKAEWEAFGGKIVDIWSFGENRSLTRVYNKGVGDELSAGYYTIDGDKILVYYKDIDADADKKFFESYLTFNESKDGKLILFWQDKITVPYKQIK